MRIPNAGEGFFICRNCGHRITFPTPEGEKAIIGPFGILRFPKCPECGRRKFKRDERWQS